MFIENESNCHGCCHHEQIIESDVFRMLFSYFTICIMVMFKGTATGRKLGRSSLTGEKAEEPASRKPRKERISRTKRVNGIRGRGEVT